MSKPNLIFMHGDDSFSMRQEIQRWKQAFLAKHGDMNLEEIDGGRTTLAQLATQLGSLPFLADKRLVILNNFLDQQKADTKKALVPLLEELPDSTVCVIAEANTPDKRSSLYKWLNKNSTLRLFHKPKGMGLTQWVQAQARKQGGSLDGACAQRLIQDVGNDLWRLSNEVQKLCLYAQGQPITTQMLDELVHSSVERSIFVFTDQLARQDHNGALRSLRELQNQGEEALYIFAMIVRQFRLMLEMKALTEQGTPPRAIASKMKVHPFVVEKTLGACRRFSAAQLRTLLNKLLTIDRRLKTGHIHLRPREEDNYFLAIERALLNN